MLDAAEGKNAHTLFGAVADELEKDVGRKASLMPRPGWRRSCRKPVSPWAQKFPPNSRRTWSSVFRIASEISRLDIGQTVVVKNGAVLAVEGFEGTDNCLTRGGELAGKNGGAVAVKVAKINHDMRFDIPCIGPKTFESLRDRKNIRAGARSRKDPVAGARGLRAELAKKNKISVTTITGTK